MHARVGDRLVIRSAHLDGPVRDGEIVGVSKPDGTPPYVVRWEADGHESTIFPGADAYVEHTAADGGEGQDAS